MAEKTKKTKLKETPKAKVDESPKKESISTKGRIFEGIVKKKFPRRIVLEFERMVYVRKYERYKITRTKLHARVPFQMEKEINKGDRVQIQECRPLSKIVHFSVIRKIGNAEEAKAK